MEGEGNSKKQNSDLTRLLVVGLIMLICCIGVCVFLVVSLRSTYRQEISDEFQAQHITAGEVLNRYLFEDGKNLRGIEVSISSMEKEPTDQDICIHLRNSSEYESIDYLGYVCEDHHLYINGEVPENVAWAEPTQIFIEMDALNYGDDNIYIGKAPESFSYIGWDGFIVAVPYIRAEEVKGYFFSYIDLDAVLDYEAFSYQSRIGECLLVSTKGEIYAHSDNNKFINEEDVNAQLGILEYSDGEEFSKRAVQEMSSSMTKGESGYVTVRSNNGYRVQVSYCPVPVADDLYFLSCYEENLVDARVKPLIFISVLSCILILIMMVAVIIYVWASAKRANVEIERLAYEDPVTKGRNLNYFREFATNMMYHAKETPFVIYRFDIAHFRYINESYGHRRADAILKSCIVRFGEIFSDKEICVRMLADQFLALLVNDARLDKRMQEYQAMVNADARGNNVKYPVRFKTGVYKIKKHDHDIDTMIDHANVARKAVAGDEKTTKVIYSDSIVDDMRKVDRIESLMQKALADLEFKVYLQPKWDIFEDHVVGAEALVRWVRPDGSLIFPDQFIPIFENNGFVEQLDFFMLENVCAAIRRFNEAGIRVCPISVNQSRLLLHSPDYVDNVAKILGEYRVDPSMIELEITESVFDEDRENMINIIRRLKAIGVHLAMDDFGSGYSSLNMLKDVPFDVVKIDRNFFSGATENAESQWILHKVVEMVQGLNMETVCEGVETPEQVAFLKSVGCRKVQGYYYFKPMPEEEFWKRFFGSEGVQ